MTFSFDIGRKRPLLNGPENVLTTNRRIAEILSSVPDGAGLSSPVFTNCSIETNHVTGHLDPSLGQWQSAADLKAVDADTLRMLRFKFRDWRAQALNILMEPHHLEQLGLDEMAISNYLDSDNALLYAVPGEFESLQWCCLFGFQFGNHALNHISDFSGEYKPSELSADPSDLTPPKISLPADRSMQRSSAPPPPVAHWWRGHQHQIFLVFACGFLTASIAGAIIFKLSPCDISDVRNQIESLSIQIDQRCNFPQTSRQ